MTWKIFCLFPFRYCKSKFQRPQLLPEHSVDLLRPEADGSLPLARREGRPHSGLVCQGQPQGLGNGLLGQRDHMAPENFPLDTLQ
jgi:hypothetical protein